MKVVISPAKNLDFKTDTSHLPSSECEFLKTSEKLIKKLKKLSPDELSELMKISPALAELNYNRNQEWELPLKEEAKQAIFAFNGEVYNGLSAETFSEVELLKSQNSLRILSGLYGILRPLDKIMPYRLEMGTSFATSATKKNLYQFWGDQLVNHLNNEMKLNNDKALINLASNEYFKALNSKKIKSEIYTPIFKDSKNGQYKTIMMYAKKARGMMARFIIENEIKNPEDLKAFDTDGYVFNPQLSKNNEWVFTRG